MSKRYEIFKRVVFYALLSFFLCPIQTVRAASELPLNNGRLYRLVGGASLWFWSELQKEHLASKSCKWCESNALDSYVRDHWRWQDTKKADELSNLITFGILPVSGLALLYRRSSSTNRFENLSILGEAVVYSALLNQGTKLLVARQRPFVAALSASARENTKEPADNNLSFYSGHTSTSFAVSVAVLRMVGQGVDDQTLRWGLLGLAGAAGYLRIAADKHYATDVVVGALTGSVFALSLTETDKSAIKFFATPYFAGINYQF
jgi:membrane-associated phospholipid phosphatase